MSFCVFDTVPGLVKTQEMCDKIFSDDLKILQ